MSNLSNSRGVGLSTSRATQAIVNLHLMEPARGPFTYDPELGNAEAEALWMVRAPGRVVVAEAHGGEFVGTVNMYANRAGPGAPIASASYLVDPAHQGRGVGRALGFTIVGTIPGGFRHPVDGDVGLHVMFYPL